MAVRLMLGLAVAPMILTSVAHAGASELAASRPGVLGTGRCLVADRDGRMVPGSYLRSRSGVFTLAVSPESVMINEDHRLPGGAHVQTSTWWQFEVTKSRNPRPDRTRLCMRGNGNLALRTSKGKLIWSSHTAGTGHHNYLTMQNDGNLVVRTGKGKAVWSSRTTAVILPDGATLRSGQHLVDRYRQQFGITPGWLFMQQNGRLVLKLGGATVWRTPTHVPGAYARLLGGGDFVIYAPSGKVIWRSHTHGRPSYLELGNGCLTFNTSSGTIWARPPRSKCSL